jgi:NitT/TauT family transport system substrate-binding protein
MMTRGRALTVAASGAAVLSAFPAVVRAQTSTVSIAASAAATQAEAYYADQLGYFKQAGITATLSSAARSAETLQLVARGDIDVASATPEGIANAVIHNIPVRIIAIGTIYVEPAAVGLYVAKDSTIKGPADLADGVVGVQSLGDSQSLGVWAWMSDNHVDPSKVKIVEMPFPSMAAALTRKDITACCMVEPFSTAAKDVVRAVPGVYASLGRHWALGVWYARADFIDKNPALTKQIVTALYTTAKHVNANPASIEQLLVSYTKLPLETVHAIVKPVFAEKAERTNIEPQLQVAAKFKVISRPVSFEEVMLG